MPWIEERKSIPLLISIPWPAWRTWSQHSATLLSLTGSTHPPVTSPFWSSPCLCTDCPTVASAEMPSPLPVLATHTCHSPPSSDVTSSRQCPVRACTAAPGEGALSSCFQKPAPAFGRTLIPPGWDRRHRVAGMGCCRGRASESAPSRTSAMEALMT